MIKDCRQCFIDKYYDKYPDNTARDTVQRYHEALMAVLDDPDPLLTSPEASGMIRAVRKKILGEEPKDFLLIKQHFNALMLQFEEELEERILHAEDPIRLAVQYAMTGNFIDFAALANVEESKLMELLEKAPDIPVPKDTLNALRKQILQARTMVFLTDNCGEIVMDKLLIRQILRMNPEMEITVIVRGARVVNDASMEDAEQVGLTVLSPHVSCMGNGAPVEGTVFRRLSDEARRMITGADLLIAKGQANYESMCGCGFNVFYIFMCKCELFMRRFGVSQFSGILTWEQKAPFTAEK